MPIKAQLTSFTLEGVWGQFKESIHNHDSHIMVATSGKASPLAKPPQDHSNFSFALKKNLLELPGGLAKGSHHLILQTESSLLSPCLFTV